MEIYNFYFMRFTERLLLMGFGKQVAPDFPVPSFCTQNNLRLEFQ